MAPPAALPDANERANTSWTVTALRRLLNRAQCQSERVDHSLANATAVPRANIDELRLIFLRYASVHDKEKHEKFMTGDDFVRKYLGLMQEPHYNRDTVALLAGAVDTTKDGLISFDEFLAFEAVLCSPDALYLTAFEMFDTNGSENISFDEFCRIIKHTQPVMEMDFNFNCNFLKRYFGKNHDRSINYYEFTQLLHDFYEEQGVQAFCKFDSEQTGFISSADFQRIMSSVKSHLLTDFVRNSLVTVSGGSIGQHRVSFPYYLAFNALLNKMEVIKRIYMQWTKGDINHHMTQEQFLLAAQPYAHVTPAEVDILFHLSELRHPGQRTVCLRDIERCDPERLKRVSYIQRLTNIKVVDSPSERGVGTQMLESAYRFTMGSVAGAIGATAVYPIDLVKTRMQNQRTGSFIGELMYKNSFDCFKKVIRHEGVRGLYRGLLPQIVGVAPEKAIKLTMNDLMRDKLTFQGHLPLWGEIVAGGTGGMCQVMFTNPLEIVKIRLQVAGELAAGSRVGVFSVLKELGFFGLYKGSRACFLRDIPFSAIYFPVYANMKLAMADENGHVGVSALFGSALTAGVPAAALVTPADVIKTRLQVAAREGQTSYDGLVDCYRKIMAEEGPKAFWKGTLARVFRSAPQFAVTLLSYEMLQRVFYVDFGGNRPVGSEVPAHRTRMDDVSENPDHLGGFRLAHATFAGIESKFGLFMPRFEIREHRPGYTGELYGATTTTTAETSKLSLI